MRRRMVIGLVAMLVTFPALSVTPAGAADMMETDKAMMKATGEDLMKLKHEVALIKAELDKLTARIGTMSAMVERAASNYCQSVPDSLRRAGFAPGLCK